MARAELRGTRRSNMTRRSEGFGARIKIWLRRVGLLCAVLLIVLLAGFWVLISDGNNAVGRRISDKAMGWASAMGYKIENILVEGRVYTDSDLVLRLVGVQKGDAVFKINPDQIRQDLSQISWVKEAHVERRLPDTLYIRLEERKPFALWDKKGHKPVVIDQEGAVLSDQDLKRFKDLIKVSGSGAPEEVLNLARMLAAEPEIKSRLDHAVRIEGRRWDLVLKGNKRLMLPEKDMGLALRALVATHEREGVMDKPFASLDVRDPSRLTVRPEVGKALEYSAQNTDIGQNL